MDFGGLGHLLSFKEGTVTYTQQRTTCALLVILTLWAGSSVARQRQSEGKEPVLGLFL